MYLVMQPLTEKNRLEIERVVKECGFGMTLLKVKKVLFL